MPVKNAPPWQIAISNLEARVVPTPAKDATAGKAACAFELRVTQESGSH